MEEVCFLRLVAPPLGHARTLSIDGARLLAAELRDAVARRHALAIARVGQSLACPFDLHALLPPPATNLQLGPDHPEPLAWLWTHWGACAFFACQGHRRGLAPAGHDGPSPGQIGPFGGFGGRNSCVVILRSHWGKTAGKRSERP